MFEDVCSIYARRRSVTLAVAPQRLSKSCRRSTTPDQALQGVGVRILNVGVQMLGIQ